ncbi:hypothetical protein MTR67_036082 [Solanum verrucosum]|uniref:Expansin-like EG45 domain-containing protein n=1 Tax=Solanum verrucosum TaxID=315347 RepID=A0AAF0UB25_SOLVR|nr:hypothetical protein MTR67_036082 [Solanum verrucosum]
MIYLSFFVVLNATSACFGSDSTQFPSSNFFAAASEGIWDDGATCGRQYLISCISSVLPKPGNGTGRCRFRSVPVRYRFRLGSAFGTRFPVRSRSVTGPRRVLIFFPGITGFGPSRFRPVMAGFVPVSVLPGPVVPVSVPLPRLILPKACKPGETIQIKIVDRAQNITSTPTRQGTTMVLSTAALAAIADSNAPSLNIDFR